MTTQTSTTIYEATKNHIYELQTLINWHYSTSLIIVEKQISDYVLSRNTQVAPAANSIDSKDLNLEFHHQMSELINVINSTENPAAVLAQHKAIDKLFIGILSPELKELTDAIKSTSASMVVSKYLIEQNFTKTLNEVEILTAMAERASNLYSSNKNDAEYKIELWGIKEKIADITKEGIFSKELEHIKTLEAQFELENFSSRIAQLQEDFGRLPHYLDITLNFRPGVLPPIKDIDLKYGQVLADEEFLTLVAQEG